MPTPTNNQSAGTPPAQQPKLGRALFSSASVHWATPQATYDALNAEFAFTLDPCPLNTGRIEPCGVADGLSRSWVGERVYCNPPYGRGVGAWLAKASEADIAIYLLPSRTDTRWWHEYAMKATEIRFLRGRLKFGAATASAPFPSVVLVYLNQSATGHSLRGHP